MIGKTDHDFFPQKDAEVYVANDRAAFEKVALQYVVQFERSAPAWERIGQRWFPTVAGVILVEASKQIYAKPTMVRVPRRRLVYTPAPHGL
jgi:hypothetical protein